MPGSDDRRDDRRRGTGSDRGASGGKSGRSAQHRSSGGQGPRQDRDSVGKRRERGTNPSGANPNGAPKRSSSGDDRRAGKPADKTRGSGYHGDRPRDGRSEKPGANSRGRDSGYKRDRPRDDRSQEPGRPNDRNRSERHSQGERQGGKQSDSRNADRRSGGSKRDERHGRPNDRKDAAGKRGFPPKSDHPRDDRSRGDRSSGSKSRFERDRGGKPGKPEQFRDRPHGERRPERSRTEAGGKGSHEGQASATEPVLPEEAVATELHGEIRRELKSLPKGLADKVAAHLVAAGALIDSEPETALAHARYARQRASRIGVVREANGIAAYEAGEWSESLAELRAARRMGGGFGHLAIMADCERALGRPERALDVSRSQDAAELVGQEAVELRMVSAGARRDLGEIEASVVSLQIPELDPQRQEPWSARLFYAYADNLLAADRVQEAFTWFVHAAHADDEGETDAPERLDELVVRLGGPEIAHNLVADAESAELGEDSDRAPEGEDETR